MYWVKWGVLLARTVLCHLSKWPVTDWRREICLLKSSGFGASTDLGVVDIKGFSDLTKFLWRGGQLHADCWLAHEAPKLLSVCHWKIAVSVHHVSCSCLQSDCFHTLRFFCTPLQWLWLTWFQHQSSTHVSLIEYLKLALSMRLLPHR